MAKYNEEAKIFANIIKDKNRLKAQIAGASDIIQLIKSMSQNFKVEMYNLVVKTQIKNDGFTFGHADYGILGTNVLGEGTGVTADQVEILRRKWVYNTASLLGTGTASANIDLTNGDVRLAK